MSTYDYTSLASKISRYTYGYDTLDNDSFGTAIIKYYYFEPDTGKAILRTTVLDKPGMFMSFLFEHLSRRDIQLMNIDFNPAG